MGQPKWSENICVQTALAMSRSITRHHRRALRHYSAECVSTLHLFQCRFQNPSQTSQTSFPIVLLFCRCPIAVLRAPCSCHMKGQQPPGLVQTPKQVQEK